MSVVAPTVVWFYHGYFEPHPNIDEHVPGYLFYGSVRPRSEDGAQAFENKEFIDKFIHDAPSHMHCFSTDSWFHIAMTIDDENEAIVFRLANC